MIPYEDVGGQTTIRHDATDGSHAVEIPFACVLSVHQLQNAVASALHRQMDMSAHVWTIGNDLQSIIAHVLRMRCGETDSHLWEGLCHLSEQHRETHFATLIGIHVLTEQCHFLVVAFLQIAYFVEDALHVTTAFASTSVGHNAIVAEVVATTHDAHESRHMIGMDTGWEHILVCFCCGKFDVDSFLAHFCRCKEVGKGEVGVWACHEVNMMVLNEVVLHALRHAAHNTHDEAAFSSLLFDSVECLQSVQDFLFGIVAHRAGIEKNGICFVKVFASLVACHLHHRGNNFTVRHVHLAAISFNE